MVMFPFTTLRLIEMIWSLQRVIHKTNFKLIPLCKVITYAKVFVKRMSKISCVNFSSMLLLLLCLHITEIYTNGLNNGTEVNRNLNAKDVNATEIPKNENRKQPVLIVNSLDVLRSSSKKIKTKKKKKGTESLKYEEYTDDGKPVNTFTMYNLDDVVTFFRDFLNTKICNTQCKDD